MSQKYFLTKRYNKKLLAKKNTILITIVILFGVLFSADFLYAKTIQELSDSMYDMMNKKEFQQSIDFYNQLDPKEQNDPELIYYLAQAYFFRDDFINATKKYIVVLKNAVQKGDNPAIKEDIRYKLADTLNQIGRKHHYSKDLLRRIIYELENVLEMDQKLANNKENLEFLRPMIARYDVVNVGNNMISQTYEGDGQAYVLPDDYVSEEEKDVFLTKARERIKEYNKQQDVPWVKTTASDILLNDLIKLIEQKSKTIRTIHYKKTNSAHGSDQLIEEVFYQSDNKAKITTPNGDFVINHNISTLLNDVKDSMKGDSFHVTHNSMMKSIQFRDFKEDSAMFDFVVGKADCCPDGLKQVCEDYAPNLYVVTGKIKPNLKTNISKKIFLVDVNTGLCVAELEYWHGVIGSGLDEELAQITIVASIQELPSGIKLPLDGITKGRVEELSNINQVWKIQVFSINKDIDDTNFIETKKL